MKIPNKVYRLIVNLLARALRSLMKINNIHGHFCVSADNAFFEIDGLRFKYHYRSFGVCGNIDSGGSSEPITRRKLNESLENPNGGKVFYDIGAHEGLFALDVTRRSKIVVHAFEPHAKALRDNVALNKATGIVVHEVAVGDRSGSVSMTVGQRSSNHITKKPGSIPEVRLDDLELPPPAAIKIDIEGFELNALRGAKGLLKRHKPTVVTEINHCFARYNQSLKPMYDLMASCGYSLNRLSDRGELIEVVERPDLPEHLPHSAEDNYWWIATER
jgi:FkbM family methyltransferase